MAINLSDDEEAEIVAKETDARYAEGLRNELAGYQRSGNEDRANQVLAELDRIGHPVEAPGPRGRRAPQKQTTAGR